MASEASGLETIDHFVEANLAWSETRSTFLYTSSLVYVQLLTDKTVI